MSSYKKTYTLPFKFDIPNYSQAFLEETSAFKRWLKLIKRYFYILLRRQNKYEVFNILPSHNRILWINLSAPSLGDSLMDLSSRIMLKGRKVDLFTDKKNACLYKNDFIFTTIYSDKKQVGDNKYDLVVIDSYSTRSIHIKADIAHVTNFVSMFGYYNGPEVNRVLFSFHQMNNLLGYVKNEDELNKIAKTSISISSRDKEIIQKTKLPSNFIAFATGGEWNYRTYNKWDFVIEKLISQDNDLNIILVGSDNARDIARVIMDKFSRYKVHNYVDKFTFNQTAEIISRAQILLCCDGGLMHAANAVNTTIVALFARLTEEMQLTESNSSFSLFDKDNVNNILVEDILNKYKEASISVHNNLLGE
jgi:ADP-heptose:LPS heptosyltransferase